MPQGELTDKERLALQIIDLGKALILADNHFLSGAVGRLKLKPSSLNMRFASDGYSLYFDADKIIEKFKESKAAPKHDLLHSIIHCIFLHPYVSPSVNQGLWNLASDIAVERAVMELCGQREGACGSAIAFALGLIERDLGCRATAEKVYNRLCEGMWAERVEAWMALFRYDSHDVWYATSDDDSEGEAQSDSSGSANSSEGDMQSNASNSGSREGQNQSDQGFDQSEGGACEQEGTEQESQDDSNSSGQNQQQNPKRTRNEGEGAGTLETTVESSHAGRGFQEIFRPNTLQQQAQWRQVATSLAVNLQTLSAKRGGALSGFVEDLEAAASERVDYADFLRQFAISGEVMRLSDDEFDYIFYTYGIKLYGNLPLVEPLEYREEKRIREFVIVIDTSGSVQGEIVRRFIDATFDILSSTESFFQKINLRIIQCDAAVQSDDVIHDLAELKEWGRSMKLLGNGGTDFRPAFEYVDALVEQGAFENLGGLVYFTDGYGKYPNWMPSYRSAFVFYDEDYRPEDVPPWAVQVVLDKDAIKQASTIGR